MNNKNLKKLLISLLFTFSTAGLINSNKALAEVGILHSDSSISYSSSKYLIMDYSERWDEIINNFNYTNLKYNVLSENKINNEDLKKYSVIVLPMLYDISDESYQKLKNYVQNGGKLVIFFSDTQVTPDVTKLIDLLGVKINDSTRFNYRSNMILVNGSKISNNEFPVTTKVANVNLNNETSILSIWSSIEGNTAAIGLSPSGAYITWRWGNDGNVNFNADVLRYLMETLTPGILAKEQAPIDFKVYKEKIAETNKYRQNSNDLLNMQQQKYIEQYLAEIQEHLFLSNLQEGLSKSYYDSKNYDKALIEINKSKENALYAYAKAAPSSEVQGRNLWLDRGTIATIKSQQQMSVLFDKIRDTGINLVYFETINSGYAVYPSKILRQNPQTIGIDPLAWAIEEAHKRGIEIHAWAWIFAAGNEKYNSIISQNVGYPGPVISKYKEYQLLGKNGASLVPNQHEYWIDPSNPKAREFIISALEEIVHNYNVDGVQLDYIRYPFQNQSSLMGYNPEAKRKFEIESGLKLDELNPNTIKIWNEWKAKQVSKFVQETSYKLRKIKPDLLISAAVFGGDRPKRLSTIQQDWETWVDKGWVDVLNPMIYASSSDKLSENIDYFRKAIGSKAMVCPGIAAKQLNTADFLDQIYATQNKGLVGNTIFAMAHLDSDKSKLLSIGPYKLKKVKLPYKHPLTNSQILLEEFISKLKDLKLSSVDEYWINNIIAETDKAHTSLIATINKPTSENVNKTLYLLRNLETYSQKTLTCYVNLDKTTVNVLTSYLNQSITLVSYSQHKQNINSKSSSYH